MRPWRSLDDLHEIGSLQQGVGIAGIEPGDAPPHPLHGQQSAFEIDAVEIGDLQFAARRRPQAGRNVAGFAIVEIEAGDREIGARRLRLFLEAGRATGRVEAHDAITLGITDPIGKHRSAFGAGGRAIEQRREPGPIEKIIAKNQA